MGFHGTYLKVDVNVKITAVTCSYLGYLGKETQNEKNEWREKRKIPMVEQ
jgi:hypothetical protein